MMGHGARPERSEGSGPYIDKALFNKPQWLSDGCQDDV